MNEPRQVSTQISYDDEIDLRELFRVVWSRKWLIGGITFLASAVALTVTLMIPNIYRAEALMAPNEQDRAGSLSALAAQYGGLASLAGINMSSGASDKTLLGLEILKSRKFISEFVERHEILVPLMAAKGWDVKSGKVEIDPDEYDVVSNRWVRSVGSGRNVIPSNQEAYEQFMKILSVAQDKQSGFVKISVEHYSPAMAKQWVDWLVSDINATIMNQDVVEAERAIEYLKRQIAVTSLADLQSVFYDLIEEQTKTIMLAQVSPEYLLKTLDPAVSPEKKVRPRRALLVGLALVISLLGSLLFVLLVASYRKKTPS